MSALSVRHLTALKHLQYADAELIFSTAKNFKEIIQRPIKKVPSLRDITIANLFFEDSTRTRISFELAEKRLSADTINFSASGSSVKKGETLLDTVRNILAMKVDMVVIRHYSSGAPEWLSRQIDATVINAGDGTHEHPTQGLLDAYSVLEKFGTLKGLNYLISGDIRHSRVANSDMALLKLMGANVRVCGPPTLIPPHLEELGIEVSYDLEESLRWCDVVNVLRIQLERMNTRYIPSLREYSLYYGIDLPLLDKIGKEIAIMHPGPINRGIELQSKVADSGHSLILQQVENGVAIRMAVLYLLAEHKK
jgi:aspartate carbamoyltransferase catalytic subunit